VIHKRINQAKTYEYLKEKKGLHDSQHGASPPINA